MAKNTMKDVERGVDKAIDGEDEESMPGRASVPSQGSTGMGTIGDGRGSDSSVESMGMSEGDNNVQQMASQIMNKMQRGIPLSKEEHMMVKQVIQSQGSTGPAEPMKGQGDSDLGWTMPGAFDEREEARTPRR